MLINIVPSTSSTSNSHPPSKQLLLGQVLIWQSDKTHVINTETLCLVLYISILAIVCTITLYSFCAYFFQCCFDVTAVLS